MVNAKKKYYISKYEASLKMISNFLKVYAVSFQGTFQKI